MKIFLSFLFACFALCSNAATYFYNPWTTNTAQTVTNITLSLVNSGFGSNNFSGSNILYVNSIIGNDSTAQPGRMDKPWLTISNACANAQTNGTTLTNFTIYVAPGVYPETAGGIGVSNNVTLIGAGPNSTIIGTNRPPGTENMPLRLRTNSTIYGVGGNFFFTLSGPNSLAVSCNATGNIDAATIGFVASNFVFRSCIFNAAVSDAAIGATLVDAAVTTFFDTISTGLYDDCSFISVRQDFGAGTTRRAAVQNGGNITYQNCRFIARNATAGNYGLHLTGSTANTIANVMPDCVFDVTDTNSPSTAVAISNNNSIVRAPGGLPLTPGQWFGSGSYAISNAVMATNLVGTVPMANLDGRVVTNNNANLSARVQVGNGARGLTDAAASGAVPVDADGSATTFAQVNTLAPGTIVTNGHTGNVAFGGGVTNNSVAGFNGNGAGITNGWEVTPKMAMVQAVQLQNGNRFFPPEGVGTTNTILLASGLLPAGPCYITNITLAWGTNLFSTTNFTLTLLTNRNPVSGVASLATGTLLGATGISTTQFVGVSCILTTNETWGCWQILGTAANTTVQNLMVRYDVYKQFKP